MKNIPVACAIIKKHGKILATQRSEFMRMPLKWEFPGGKINDGEQPEECLARELMEELGVKVEVGRPLPPVTHQYPAFSITLFPFFATIVSGDIILHEHAAMAWLSPSDLTTLDWTETDLKFILAYKSYLSFL